MTNGFIRIAAATPSVKVADTESNVASILEIAGDWTPKALKLPYSPNFVLQATLARICFITPLCYARQKKE